MREDAYWYRVQVRKTSVRAAFPPPPLKWETVAKVRDAKAALALKNGYEDSTHETRVVRRGELEVVDPSDLVSESRRER